MNNIISVQSSVFNDLVGNQAARHILSNRNYNFYEIPTVILTSHKAHKNSLQLHTQNLNPWKIFSNVKKTYKLKKQRIKKIPHPRNWSNLVFSGPGTWKIGFGMQFRVDSTHRCPKRMERCRKRAKIV